MALSYLNLFDADAAWLFAHDLAGHRPAGGGHHQARQPVRRGGGAARWPRRTSRASTAIPARPSAASSRCPSRSTRPTVEAMVAAAQADLVIAPGYGPGAIEALLAKRKNTRVLEATAAGARRAPPPADHRWPVPAGAPPVPRPAGRLAGGHRAGAHRRRVGRRRAGVAGLRAREVERHRPGQGRRGLGIGAGQQNRVESGESPARRPPGGPPAAPAPATPSTPSPTASRPRPGPGSPSSSSLVAPSATRPTSPGPTSSASRWSSPANATSSTESHRTAGRRDRGHVPRRPRAAPSTRCGIVTRAGGGPRRRWVVRQGARGLRRRRLRRAGGRLAHPHVARPARPSSPTPSTVAWEATGESGLAVEVGSGIGTYTPLLVERFGAALAVELSMEMLPMRSPAEPGHQVRADASMLPLADGAATGRRDDQRLPLPGRGRPRCWPPAASSPG